MGDDGIVPCYVERIDFGHTDEDKEPVFGRVTSTTRFEFRSKQRIKKVDMHADVMLNRLRDLCGASAWRTFQDLICKPKIHFNHSSHAI
jgi:hypothetical protein